MSTILVTGGAGFIGSSVVDALLGRGDNVCVLDNFNDFYDPEIKRSNIAKHATNAAFTLVEGDLRDPASLQRAFDGNIDAVIHLAAMAGVRPSLDDPALYVDVNLRGSAMLFDEMVAAGCTKCVFASSSSVYGANDKIPFAEDDRVDHPVSPYAATKKAGELVAHTYHHIHGLDMTCLRFFTVYGPRQRPEMAIHKFTRMIEAGEPVPMFGDGTTRRDYTYIDDIVDGVLKALDNVDGYHIYNLGESQTIELGELIAAIGDVLGKTPVIDHQPLQPGDVPATWADISRAREEIGYAPKTPIIEGLKSFVDWYHQTYSRGDV